MPTIHDAAKVLQDNENARLRRENTQQRKLIAELSSNAYLRACLQYIEAEKAVQLQWNVHPRNVYPNIPIMMHDDSVQDYMDNRESHHDDSFMDTFPQPIDMNPLLSNFKRNSYEEHRKVIPFLTQLGYYVIECRNAPYQGHEMWVYSENPEDVIEHDSEIDWGVGMVKLWAPGTSCAEFHAKTFSELCMNSN